MCWTRSLAPSLFTTAMLTVGITATARAEEGEPVAVRTWPGGAVSVETHWGLHLVVDPNEDTKGGLQKKADQSVRTTDQLHHSLSRRANELDVSWVSSDRQEPELSTDGRNAVRVDSVNLKDGQVGGLVIRVDGLKLLLPSPQAFSDSSVSSFEAHRGADLLVCSSVGDALPSEQSFNAWVKATAPKRLLVRSSASVANELNALESRVGTGAKWKRIPHNTLALSTSTPSADSLVVVATDNPWEMTGELKKLFLAMEDSNQRSQQVFMPLSAAQMNFKPANGTHTPRWNTEHMMGRQLQFFSQIYHELDPSIPVMDLNPKQMPADYQFAHPTWTGREEAMQMQRVSEFCRRFAYLLDGMDVNQRAPGSRWPSLRALLIQMDRHYDQHTGNTVQKFKLPGWPES